jgi:hypothetical protein
VIRPGGSCARRFRRRYAESAGAVTEGTGGCCCGSGSCCADGESDAAKFGEALYDAEQWGELPETATLASLGCGNPTAVAELRAARPCSIWAPAAASM